MLVVTLVAWSAYFDDAHVSLVFDVGQDQVDLPGQHSPRSDLQERPGALGIHALDFLDEANRFGHLG